MMKPQSFGIQGWASCSINSLQPSYGTLALADPSVSQSHGWRNLFQFQRLGVKPVALLPLSSHPAHLHSIYRESLKPASTQLLCAHRLSVVSVNEPNGPAEL
ncbi:hypothetical protein EYF80_041344 [Liparis tanakae]|uniref:Uncharacterized protein n=1 Tax=Liparis tanakae TaxID=230148 RepID=A0A4Z2G5R3_9TELE|nr:hypothetical protein EYF80_041344 [Liparis tanakae]